MTSKRHEMGRYGGKTDVKEGETEEKTEKKRRRRRRRRRGSIMEI